MSFEAQIELCRMWSGALPAIFQAPARPWNGHILTPEECRSARRAFFADGPQGALEWLSENVKGVA